MYCISDGHADTQERLLRSWQHALTRDEWHLLDKNGNRLHEADELIFDKRCFGIECGLWMQPGR